MIPIKIQCGCGQKYAFDAEMVDGRLAGAVACPVCAADGTTAANEIISQTLAASSATESVSNPTAPGIRLRVATPPPETVRVTPPPAALSQPVPAISAMPAKSIPAFSLPLGILGAVMGAIIGAAIMYGFYKWAGFRFPLMGVGTGALTGLGARILYRGTDNTLGIAAGAIAVAGVSGALYFMYGELPLISIISVAVGASVAYRIAS